MGQPCSRRIYPSLTGLRWVAAFCVWCHHFPPPVPMPEVMVAFLRELHIGVPIFFVLSGFLITLRYSEEATLDRAWLGTYARNRFARIYPIYFLVTAMTLVVLPLFAARPIDWGVLLLNLTLLRGFFEDFVFTGVPQGWTLTVEECFYFSAPLIFLLWRRWKVRTRWILAALYATGTALWLLGEQIDFHGFFSPFNFVAAYTYFGHAFAFLSGAWLARRLLAGKLPSPALPAGISMTACAAVALVLLTLLLSTGQSSSYEFGLQNPPYKVIYLWGLPPVICLLIAGLTVEKTWIGGMLSTRLFVLLGKASYCFYLIHMGFMQGYFHKLVPKDWGKHRYWAEFALLVAAAILLYMLVEKPLNRLMRKRHGTAAN